MKTTPHALFTFLADGAASPEAAPNPFLPLVGYLLLFAAMYFFLFAPARKAQKEREKLQSQLEVGQEVMTSTGIFGRVTLIKDSRVTLELDSGRMTVHKSAIAGLATDDAKVLSV